MDDNEDEAMEVGEVEEEDGGRSYRRGRDRERQRERSNSEDMDRSRSPKRSSQFQRSANLKKIGRAHRTQKFTKRRLPETGEPEMKGVKGPIKSVGGYVIFISGIHEESSREDIEDMLSAYETVTSIHVYKDRKGQLKDYAMIEFSKSEEAQKAISKLNDSSLLGQKIKVSWAFV